MPPASKSPIPPTHLFGLIGWRPPNGSHCVRTSSGLDFAVCQPHGHNLRAHLLCFASGCSRSPAVRRNRQMSPRPTRRVTKSGPNTTPTALEYSSWAAKSRKSWGIRPPIGSNARNARRKNDPTCCSPRSNSNLVIPSLTLVAAAATTRGSWRRLLAALSPSFQPPPSDGEREHHLVRVKAHGK